MSGLGPSPWHPTHRQQSLISRQRPGHSTSSTFLGLLWGQMVVARSPGFEFCVEVFHNWDPNNWMVYNVGNPIKWMIWRYPHWTSRCICHFFANTSFFPQCRLGWYSYSRFIPPRFAASSRHVRVVYVWLLRFTAFLRWFQPLKNMLVTGYCHPK